MLFWYFNPNPNPASLVKQGHGDRRDEVMLRNVVLSRSHLARSSLSPSRRAAQSALSRAGQWMSRRAGEAPQPSRAAGDARRRRKEGSSRTPQFTSSSSSPARRSIAASQRARAEAPRLITLGSSECRSRRSLLCCRHLAMGYCACVSSLRQYQHRLLVVQLRRVPLTLQEHLATIAVAAVNEEGEWLVKIRWRKYHCG